MNKNLLVATLISLAILTVFYSKDQNKTDAFEEWKGKHGAYLIPEEEVYRRLIFEKNVALIERHNADASQTYKKGVNQFTIFTEEEFITKFLTPMYRFGAEIPTDNTYTVNGDIDWTSKDGAVTPIKNQGSCGSCWAFSATGVMESWAGLKGNKVNLAEQQLVDCSSSYGNHGCQGGWPSNALKYVIANGIASTSEYPYVAKNQNCAKTGGSFKVGGQKANAQCSGLVNGLATSPVSVTVDASNWSSYHSGILSTCGSGINHAVLLVGAAADGTWKIKNSWGVTWGESGFIRLKTGSTCGLCSYPGVTIA